MQRLTSSLACQHSVCLFLVRLSQTRSPLSLTYSLPRDVGGKEAEEEMEEEEGGVRQMFAGREMLGMVEALAGTRPRRRQPCIS